MFRSISSRNTPTSEKALSSSTSLNGINSQIQITKGRSNDDEYRSRFLIEIDRVCFSSSCL